MNNLIGLISRQHILVNQLNHIPMRVSLGYARKSLESQFTVNCYDEINIIVWYGSLTFQFFRYVSHQNIR